MNMKAYEYGNSNARVVLLQPVDDHDLSVIDAEVQALSALTNVDFHLIAMKVENWNRDLSPWKAPAVFGNEDFGDGAEETLAKVLEETGVRLFCIEHKERNLTNESDKNG